MFVSAAEAGDSFTSDGFFPFVLLFEFGKGHRFVILLLLFQLVDQLHLFIDLDEKILDMTIYVVHVSGDLGLDVLRAVRISERILGFIEVLA